MFEAKTFDELTTEELYEIMCIRADVFITEEKILYPDADGLDTRCLHIFNRLAKATMNAYLRMFEKTGEPGVVQIGRVLTLDRGTGLGKRLMDFAIDRAKEKYGAKEIFLESQKHAEGFYQKLGFERTSEEFIEAGIPHVEMRKEL